MSLRSLLWQLLAFGALPAWLLAGAADWLCHRRTRIDRTAGPRESVLHLLLYAEIVIPLLLGLWLEITAAMLAIMAAGVVAHMLTSWWDTSFAQPRRHIAPIEQQVHSWLEMLPLFALVMVGALHANELVDPRWTLQLRESPLPAATRSVILLALAAGAAIITEEIVRGLRAALSEKASAPVADRLP